jgi:hypothetical protein
MAPEDREFETEDPHDLCQHEIRQLQAENERLKLRIMTAAGDDLCRLTQDEINEMSLGKVKIPPKEEFIASCERFHEQMAAELGELPGCLTLAQMVAENEKLRTAIKDAGFSVMETSGNWSIHDVSEAARVEDERTLDVVNRNIELEVENTELRKTIARWERLTSRKGGFDIISNGRLVTIMGVVTGEKDGLTVGFYEIKLPQFKDVEFDSPLLALEAIEILESHEKPEVTEL